MLITLKVKEDWVPDGQDDAALPVQDQLLRVFVPTGVSEIVAVWP